MLITIPVAAQGFVIGGFFKFGFTYPLFLLSVVMLFVLLVFVRDLLFALRLPRRIAVTSTSLDFTMRKKGTRSINWNELRRVSNVNRRFTGISIQGAADVMVDVDCHISGYKHLVEQLREKAPSAFSW